MPNQTEGHYRPHTAKLLRQFDAIARLLNDFLTARYGEDFSLVLKRAPRTADGSSHSDFQGRIPLSNLL